MIDVIVLMQTLENEDERNYFTKLYDDYAAKVKKVVRRYVYNDSDADDVVGLIFIKILEDKDSFAGVDDTMAARIVYRKTKSTCINIIKSTCINIIKKKKIACVSIMDFLKDEEGNTADYDIPDETDIPEELVRAESVEKLQEALRTLPFLHREILRLKFMEEYTNVQIAAELGLNTSTVGTIIHRCIIRLKTLLEEYHYDK